MLSSYIKSVSIAIFSYNENFTHDNYDASHYGEPFRYTQLLKLSCK